MLTADSWKYEYFTRAEMLCKCGKCGGVPPDTFMQALVKLRKDCGFAFIITSAYRCPEYNQEIGGTYDGPHTRGAVDISIYGERALIVVELARMWGMTGIGVSQKGEIKSRFIHIDMVPAYAPGFHRPTLWSY